MPSVDDIVSDILRREGGYVNDPQDPGGATNFGISLATLRRLGLDVDKNGQIDAADVRALPKSEAIRIYKQDYYQKPKIDRLPEIVQPGVFDMYVNAGGSAISILQRLIGKFGFAVQVDAAIGPQTVTATGAALQSAPDHFVDAYAIARRNYYYRLADQRPNLRKFARRRDGGKGGWITRAEEFMAPRFRLGAAEHAARVAKWA